CCPRWGSIPASIPKRSSRPRAKSPRCSALRRAVIVGTGRHAQRCARPPQPARASIHEKRERHARRTHETQAQSMSALQGIRVLDLGTFIAGPYCATILGEFGAEVIKVEPPGEGDSLRRLGTNTECGDTLVWLSESRNKKCVTLNLRTPRGRSLLKQLAAKCDVVVENFRPGTLEKWGLGYDELKRLNPGVVLVRISAYGQDGPMRTQPGFARIAHAFSGLAYLAGEPGGIPVVPGSTSLADYMSGMYGAIGALVALQARAT